MFDFMENFFSRSIDTVRTALYLMVIGLAVYAGISKKSFVAFITTAAIGGLAVWMISPAGFNIFPGLFDDAAGDANTEQKCDTDSAGNPLGFIYIDGKKANSDGTLGEDRAAYTGPAYVRPANKVGFRCDPKPTAAAAATETSG